MVPFQNTEGRGNSEFHKHQKVLSLICLHALSWLCRQQVCLPLKNESSGSELPLPKTLKKVDIKNFFKETLI